LNVRPMTSQPGAYRPAECLNVYRLPARLDARQTASILGFQSHDIPVLVAAKLLEPLGKPVPNAPKYFAACVLEELRCNSDWLDRASRAVSRHWRVKNGKKGQAGGGEGQSDDPPVALAG
jgi:hypothetical protein